MKLLFRGSLLIINLRRYAQSWRHKTQTAFPVIQVTTLYTAPTAIRSLMSFGDDHILGTNRASLRILGSVGEPINPEAWRWFHNV